MNTITHKNIFSCDVEDWYQSSHDFEAPISNRVFSNVSKCLSLLDEVNVKGTFFIQGFVAEQRPEVVRLIDDAGHEIATHGHSHRPVYSMSRAQFYEDISTSVKRIEDITGKKVRGYRAPDFSIFNETSFAFEVLQECGIEYDSSLFPLRTGRYGNPGCSLSPFRIKDCNIIEFPISVYSYRKIKIPVAGGGYIRLLPLSFLKHAVSSINADKNPFILYCHPYEFDSDEWRHINERIPLYRRVHQGLGRSGFPKKIFNILKENSFGSFDEVIAGIQKGQMMPERSFP